MKVKHLAIIAILLLCFLFAAQKTTTGSISGTVSDKTKTKLTGITVVVIKDGVTIAKITTDKKGYYRLDQLSPGSYRLEYISEAHEAYIKEPLKVKAGKKTVWNPTLTPLLKLNQAENGTLQIKTHDNKGNALQYVNSLVLKDGNRITGGQSDEKGNTIISVPPGTYKVKSSLIGHDDVTTEKVKITANQKTKISVVLNIAGIKLSTVTTIPQKDRVGTARTMNESSISGAAVSDMAIMPYAPPSPYTQPGVMMPPNRPPFNTEDYTAIKPNIFHSPLAEPLSTFSIDVDTANYSNIRRMLNQGFLPEPKSVRIEELVNYFAYDYPQPEGDHPFAVYTEMSVCPWNQKRNLVHIGLQGRKLNLTKAPPSNLVFLLDVSGSMNAPNKLPLVVESMKMLSENLRGTDKVAIVVYAGAAGEVLPSTSGNQKMKINEALDRLQAGGSTAGGAGINLAYKIAEENYIQGGNNRIILCTDGDFNVGASSDAHLTDLIEQKRSKGVYLTVLGFGMGNYKDNKLELLADKGNGNYAYIDNLIEAKKFLVNEMASTLYTIAKDVKLQIEFNPAHVKAYRLIGYENRLLNKEDFKDDTKDAGELGAGHNVTAVYEIIPMESKETIPELDELKYQDNKISEAARKSPEALTVKLRYKLPDSDTSTPFEVPVYNKTLPLEKASENYKFSAAVIGYGLMLQESENKAALTWQMVKDLAKESLGKDSEGYRAEFLTLIDSAAKLQEKKFREDNRDFNKGY
jgi:Ca-activated chloride channel family protein